jgi:hypothetical protein
MRTTLFFLGLTLVLALGLPQPSGAEPCSPVSPYQRAAWTNCQGFLDDSMANKVIILRDIMKEIGKSRSDETVNIEAMMTCMGGYAAPATLNIHDFCKEQRRPETTEELFHSKAVRTIHGYVQHCLIINPGNK